jgi:DNA-binding response OmpR family regulator
MSKKILIADDSPTVRNIAESMLRKHGYDVLLAENGIKALQTAKLEKPEIMFLDRSLPGLGGEEILKELKQSEDTKYVQVIMFLSKEEEARERELKAMGVKAFLIKPFNPKEMLVQLEDLLYKKEGGSAKVKVETNFSDKKARSNRGLDILETSDLMEDFDQSIPATEKTGVHGFDWFLSELQKEVQEEEKPESSQPGKIRPPVKKAKEKSTGIKPVTPLSKSSAEEGPTGDYRFGGDDSTENFIEDLRMELAQMGTEEPESNTPLPKLPNQTPSVQWIGDLKERISERIAREVTQMLSPEFLEKIIREEITRLKEHAN